MGNAEAKDAGRSVSGMVGRRGSATGGAKPPGPRPGDGHH